MRCVLIKEEVQEYEDVEIVFLMDARGAHAATVLVGMRGNVRVFAYWRPWGDEKTSPLLNFYGEFQKYSLLLYEDKHIHISMCSAALRLCNPWPS